MDPHLKETRLLDYSDTLIRQLVAQKGWKNLNDVGRTRSVYDFVRNEIRFGYNSSDEIPASQVLKDGYGQCNTKATLLMALLRAVGIPNRIHGFTIDKTLQKGAITGIWYRLSPNSILHSWVEVFVNGNWYFLEGVILDNAYLQSLKKLNSNCTTVFCGYGAYTDNFSKPPVEWNLNHTYIQHKGINRDFGIFDTPDDFYKHHRQELGLIKKWVFKNIVRHLMNRNVSRIRNQG